MGVLDRLEDEFVDLSTSRATVRELFELAFGSVLFVLFAGGLAYYLLGRTAALAVVAVLAVVFAVTIVSQAYWALTGRTDYED
ncbi:hypothetical protein SAMN05444422_107247 [Halobiforma haloterrestris]|uniref:Uncharacterized protein n=1 Tax=Natronobacterium haloterrestre TaxID=148448 RepID=A0A1I1ILV2_NATHA|nr:hypothetical protein [Halobiforma haloterrestris]SFC37207.1 hypothetical protein SAMN05444422_107247 [Halobiforma haloterrestris]